MRFLPKGARWYLAGLILEHTIEGDPRNVVHVNTHLIEAASPEEAYQKANVLGRVGEMEYANTDGKRVRVAFRGLRDLDVIHDDLEDGAELFYEEKVDISEDTLERWVKTREELSVFAPSVARSDGPNYLPQEFAELLEVERVSRPVDEGRLRD